VTSNFSNKITRNGAYKKKDPYVFTYIYIAYNVHFIMLHTSVNGLLI